jgi:hypothetical protein
MVTKKPTLNFKIFELFMGNDTVHKKCCSWRRYIALSEKSIKKPKVFTKHFTVTTHVLERSISCKPECFESANPNSLHPASPILFPAHQNVNTCKAHKRKTIPHHASSTTPQPLHELAVILLTAMLTLHTYPPIYTALIDPPSEFAAKQR